jgi:flagellar FliL protein
MAEAAAPAPAEGAAPEGGKKRMLILALTLGGTVVGGLLGSFVVAPRIIARQHPAVVAADSATAAAPAEGEPGKDGDAGGEKKLVELSNIIVNPAGSQGTRFLMTSVAISVNNEEAQKLLTARQVELRDRITSILETQTMAQLTAPGERDTLKVRITQVISAIVGPKVPLKVYLPQFVIQ